MWCFGYLLRKGSDGVNIVLLTNNLSNMILKVDLCVYRVFQVLQEHCNNVNCSRVGRCWLQKWFYYSVFLLFFAIWTFIIKSNIRYYFQVLFSEKVHQNEMYLLKTRKIPAKRGKKCNLKFIFWSHWQIFVLFYETLIWCFVQKTTHFASKVNTSWN